MRRDFVKNGRDQRLHVYCVGFGVEIKLAGAAVSICNGTVAGIGFGVGIVFTGAAVSICTGTEAGIKSVVGFRLGATLRSQSLMGWVV